MPRALLTRSAAAAIAASALVLSGLNLSGAAASVAAPRQANGAPVWMAITSVSPDFARPGTTVTVTGTLTNISSNKISGLSIQLRSSGTAFNSRGQLQAYANGTDPFADRTIVGAVTNLPGTLAPRATVGWSVALPGSQLPMSAFGVYPLAAEADSSAQTQLAVSRTFLPFWPGKNGVHPQRQDLAWIWPLMDQPRQGVCAGLLNNGLAASFGSGGRLSGLLDAGRAYAGSAHLTWAIDPALLANAVTMKNPYRTGGIAGCPGQRRQQQPGSRAAGTWLTQLRSATADQQLLLTPYDDADIAALTRYSLSADLERAFTQGRQVAGLVLGRSFSPTAGGLNGMAWPADGSASRADLENLAASDGINTVVLGSSTMPPAPQQNYTPSAQTTTPDGAGSSMNVLLSDDTITQVIGSANSASDSKATAFSVAQRYLAETAMIAAEQPGLARSILVAPPRRWNPPAGLASDLLSETVRAPWLKPVSLVQLAAVKHPAGQVTRQAPPRRVRGARLGRALVSQVRDLDQQVRLLKSIQLTAAPSLDHGIFAIESSAWRGGGQAGQVALTQQISADLARQEKGLKILVTQREQLTGKTGTVPVSIANRLSYDVQVRLRVDPGGGVTVRKQPGTMTVKAGTQRIVTLPVTASGVGSTTLTLSLLTPEGTPIPGARASMTIQATHYGTLALVIIAAVLGVFMITSGVRTFRRRGRGARDDAASADSAGSPAGPRDPGQVPPDAGRASHDAALHQPDWPAEQEEADTVMSDRLTTGRLTTGRLTTGRTRTGRITTGHANGHDPSEAEETDDYAWAPGWTDRR
jgi:hypothetical protein